MTWSFLMSWMTLVDPKDHILKVLCLYLKFLLSCSGCLNKLLTCQREERQVILMVALPKAGVRQGLPNNPQSDIQHKPNSLNQNVNLT